MKRLRLLDARMILLQRQGRVGFYGAAQGQEAVPIATGLAVGPDDWVFPALREQSVMLVRGFPLRAFVAQVFGNAGDVLKGRQMPSHPSGRAVHQVSWSSCIGPQIPQAVGAAWAMRARKTGAVAIGFLGDGATSQADFHAAMNFAGVWKVPCVLVCQNNHWSISVPAEKQTASRTFAVKARAYGMPGVRVDGNDLLAVSSAMQRGARAGALGRRPDVRRGGHLPHGPAFDERRPLALPLPGRGRRAGARKDPLAPPAQAPRAPRPRHRRERRRARGRARGGDRGGHRRRRGAAAARRANRSLDDVYAEMPWHLREQLESLKKIGPPPTHV